MRVAVVTPYHLEPLETLRRCHDSVASQTLGEVLHVMVADGHPRPELDAWPVRHTKLASAHGDYGDAARTIGSMDAAGLGVDAIAFLDADNWYEPDHLETLVRLQRETSAHIVTAARNLRRPDGSLLGACTICDGERFCDTSGYFITRAAFGALGAWSFKDPASAIVGDQVLWSIVKGSNARLAHSPRPTVNYTTMWAVNYVERGEPPPAGAKVMVPGEGPYPRMMDYEEAVRLGLPTGLSD
jgi:hypothetical protein